MAGSRRGAGLGGTTNSGEEPGVRDGAACGPEKDFKRPKFITHADDGAALRSAAEG